MQKGLAGIKTLLFETIKTIKTPARALSHKEKKNNHKYIHLFIFVIWISTALSTKSSKLLYNYFFQDIRSSLNQKLKQIGFLTA